MSLSRTGGFLILRGKAQTKRSHRKGGFVLSGVPTGIRTPVTAVKGRRSIFLIQRVAAYLCPKLDNRNSISEMVAARLHVYQKIKGPRAGTAARLVIRPHDDSDSPGKMAARNSVFVAPQRSEVVRIAPQYLHHGERLCIYVFIHWRTS